MEAIPSSGRGVLELCDGREGLRVYNRFVNPSLPSPGRELLKVF